MLAQIALDRFVSLAYMFHVERATWWRDLLVAGVSELELHVSDKVISQLIVYAAELISWNRKINLTGITDAKEIIVKHFLDSLVCTKAVRLRSNDTLLDVGSGAGFPGLPVKILYPEVGLTLLEPSGKKTAFLHHVIGTLGLEGALAVSKRVQDFSQDPVNHRKYAYATSRALSAAEILPFIPPLLAQEGQLILWRTQPLQADSGFRGFSTVKEMIYRLPFGYGERRIFILEKQ